MRIIISTLILLVTISVNYAQQLEVNDSINAIAVYDKIILSIVKDNSNILEIKERNIEADEIIVIQEKGLMTLRIESGKRSTAEVKLILKSDKIYNISGFGKAEIITENIIKTDSLNISLRSGAQGYIDMDVNFLDAMVLEGSLLTSEGYAVNQNIKALTGATFSGFKLEGKTGVLEAGSNGKIKVNISDTLDASARLGGYIGFLGNPEFVTKKVSLKGEIVKHEPIK